MSAEAVSNNPEPVNAAQGVTPARAAAAKSEATMSTQISSFGQLNKEAPELVKAMEMGIALVIVRGMEKHKRRLKEIMADARRDAKGG